MKKALLYSVCALALFITTSSCQTGYSKSSYVSKLEKFVNKVEVNCNDYNERDWNKADERMTAFKQKYEKYEEKFTSTERRTVKRAMWKYRRIRIKAGLKDVWGDVTGAYDEGKGFLEDLNEGIEGIKETLSPD